MDSKKKYRLKLGPAAVILIAALCAASVTGIVFAVLGIARAELAVDYFTSVTPLCFLIFFLASAFYFAFGSYYAVAPDAVIVRTAYFKDKLAYKNIKRIFHFATENQFYIELDNPNREEIVHIRIRPGEIHSFASELTKAAPDIPYDVSLKLSDDE